jgi:spiro-SPASM protein
MAIEKVFEMSIISVDMKNLAVANGLSLRSHALEAIPPGQSALKRVGEYARSLPAVDRPVLLLPRGGSSSAAQRGTGRGSRPEGRPGSPGPSAQRLPDGVKAAAQDIGFRVEQLNGESAVELLRCLQSLASGYDNIFYFFADCPMLDLPLSERMLASHRNYFADYTFADGFPYGLSPEILKPAVLPALLTLAEKNGAGGAQNSGGHGAAERPPIQASEREALFELIKKDINAFDIETELSPVDLRQLRARLCADSKRDLLLVRRVIEAGATGAEGICRLLQEKPEILRTLPAFFNIQIVAGCPQLCSYCPYPRFGIDRTGKQDEMPLQAFTGILDQISLYCQEAAVSVSLWGEPAYHSRFAAVAAAALERGLRLIVETSGIGWQEGVFAEIERTGNPDWIVSLDSRDPKEYGRLRGEGFEEAHRSVELLGSIFPGHVYPQAVRMKENEENLESFYRHWKRQLGRVIVQKYDPFCGFLPDRRVTDLSPLKRFPCWHLKRDVTVLLDGRVCLCREDLKAEHVLGNLFEAPLEEIWTAGEPYYRAHIQQRYPELCSHCDEYYSFNF